MESSFLTVGDTTPHKRRSSLSQNGILKPKKNQKAGCVIRQPEGVGLAAIRAKNT